VRRTTEASAGQLQEGRAAISIERTIDQQHHGKTTDGHPELGLLIASRRAERERGASKSGDPVTGGCCGGGGAVSSAGRWEGWRGLVAACVGIERLV
jgi:hypothetical protein